MVPFQEAQLDTVRELWSASANPQTEARP